MRDSTWYCVWFRICLDRCVFQPRCDNAACVIYWATLWQLRKMMFPVRRHRNEKMTPIARVLNRLRAVSLSDQGLVEENEQVSKRKIACCIET